jgi:chromosome segregation ATPase
MAPQSNDKTIHVLPIGPSRYEPTHSADREAADAEPTTADIELAKKHGWRYWFDNYQEMLNQRTEGIKAERKLEARISELEAQLADAEKLRISYLMRAEKAEAQLASPIDIFLSARVAELEAQLLEASELLEKPIGYGVGILCVAEAVKLVLARLAETHTKLNTEMAEHTREVLSHAITQSRAEKAEAQLASARTERDDWRNRRDAAIIRTEEAEEREDAAEARAEAAKTALADRIEHCEKHHSEEIKRQRNYIEALEHDVKYFKEAKESAESQAEAMRKALEEYADLANWHVDREYGPAHWSWLGGDPTAIAQSALAPASVESEMEK